MKAQKELLEDINRFVVDSRLLLAQGSVVDLSGLEKKVQNLCAQVLELPRDEQADYAALLGTLERELSVLGADLAVQKEAVEHEIRYLSGHKKANIAYKIADAKGQPASEEE